MPDTILIFCGSYRTDHQGMQLAHGRSHVQGISARRSTSGAQPGFKNQTGHVLEEWFWRPAATASYSAGRFASVRDTVRDSIRDSVRKK